MNEKVLDLLIERVQESAKMVQLLNNKSWAEQLEGDKKTLKEYCLKHSSDYLELKDSFKFIYTEEGNIIYEAKIINDYYFMISWRDGDGGGREHHKDSIIRNIESGVWRIIE